MQKNIFNKGLIVGIVVLVIEGSVVSGFNMNLNNNFQPMNRDWLYVGGNGTGNYTTIKSAINASNPGDTIFVYNGTYNEHIAINKQITLLGEERNTTIIDGGNSGHIIIISTDGVTISDFTIRNSGTSTYIAAIRINGSDSNIIKNNIFFNCLWEIYLTDSWNNEVYYNYFEYPTGFGRENIRIESNCSYNYFHNNTFLNSSVRLLYGCNYNIFENNTFNTNGPSPSPFSNYNIIRFNFINWSIIIDKSDNNVIYGNTIANGIDTLYEGPANNNIIYQNNFICENSLYMRDQYTNTWYNLSIQEGNFWVWYDEPSEGAWDNNSDGIVDLPYIIPYGSNQDLYPLMYPWYPTHPETVYVDDDYDLNTSGFGYDKFNKIQYGINEVSENGTVYVFNGTYYENIIIEKTLTLKGENKETTIIDGNGIGNVINVSADFINISDFTIQNSSEYYDGIDLFSNCSSIINNNIQNNGIGLVFEHSSKNIILSNNISNNLCGIYTYKLSNNNSISNNILINNLGDGINISNSYCYNNFISGNTISNNFNGISLFLSNNSFIFSNTINNNFIGIRLSETNNNTIYNNTINNNYWDGILISDTDGKELFSHNNIIYNNIIENNLYVGILLHNTNNNIFSNNIIINNTYGIKLEAFSNNNVIVRNNISSNGNYGIYTESDYPSTNNVIYHNNFISNMINSYDECTNTWYNTTILEGNYWDNYTGTDNDGNGIGDIPYNISGGNNQDLYPLMHPFEIYYILNIIPENITVNESTVFNVTIKSLGGTHIPDVLVEFNDELKLTDSNGVVNFTAPQVENDTYYEIIATKEGYTGANKTILVKNVKNWISNVIIFGLITNLTTAEENIEFNVKFVGVVQFFPVSVKIYNSGQKFIISKYYRGLVGYRFIFTYCDLLI